MRKDILISVNGLIKSNRAYFKRIVTKLKNSH